MNVDHVPLHENQNVNLRQYSLDNIVRIPLLQSFDLNLIVMLQKIQTNLLFCIKVVCILVIYAAFS